MCSTHPIGIRLIAFSLTKSNLLCKLKGSEECLWGLWILCLYEKPTKACSKPAKNAVVVLFGMPLVDQVLKAS